MGIAAPLFYSSNDSDKQTLLRRCSPSDEQYDEQKDRWNDLRDHLVADLKERSGYGIQTWLQGSYKFGTQIRPVRKDDEFDIDLGVYFQWSGQPDDGTHGPETLKSFVQDSLKAYSKLDSDDVEEVTPPKTRCCRIRYRNSFHIDVPAYHLDAARDARTLTTTDGWEASDPKAIYLWFRNSFEEAPRHKVRRQVRYLKTWAALKFAPDAGRPSSILLAVLAADAAIAIGAGQIGADDEALRDILESIVKRLDKSLVVDNPIDTSENLNRLTTDQATKFLANLKDFLDVANRATAASTESEAAGIWQEAFEHMFPMPEPEILAQDIAKASIAIITPEIRVTATSRTNAQAPSFKGLNGIGPIPKDCDLVFEVANANMMPAGAQFHWVVRNEGREAELVNDLGHSGQVGLQATEQSAYKGTHYMDCLVKVGRRTVAIRRVPVVISGLSMPLRTPQRKLRLI